MPFSFPANETLVRCRFTVTGSAVSPLSSFPLPVSSAQAFAVFAAEEAGLAWLLLVEACAAARARPEGALATVQPVGSVLYWEGYSAVAQAAEISSQEPALDELVREGLDDLVPGGWVPSERFRGGTRAAAQAAEVSSQGPALDGLALGDLARHVWLARAAPDESAEPWGEHSATADCRAGQGDSAAPRGYEPVQRE